MRIHDLKTWPDEFDAIARGEKRFEWRKDDRGYEVGDLLRLFKWDPATARYVQARGEAPIEDPTSIEADNISAHVTYVLRGGKFGVPEGYCVMSLAPCNARSVSPTADEEP